MRLSATALTNTGRRESNQDAYLVDEHAGVFAVADGMGGYQGGEVASALAVATLADFVRGVQRDDEQTWPFGRRCDISEGENTLDQAIRLAHRFVVGARPSPNAKMGTTIAALLVDGETLSLAHVGDSRIYRWRNGELTQLTRDHSVVEELRAKGVLDDDDCPARFGHLITRALGVDGWSYATTGVDTPQHGDRYLLCSDGLSAVVSASTMAAHLAFPSRLGAAERLVHAALEHGSTDNITVVVVGVSAA